MSRSSPSRSSVSSWRSPREKPGRRLVEHQRLRLRRERHRDRDLPVLAVGQRADDFVELVGDGHPAGRGASPLSDLPLLAGKQDWTQATALDAHDRQVDGVLDGEPEEETRLLVRARQPDFRPVEQDDR